MLKRDGVVLALSGQEGRGKMGWEGELELTLKDPTVAGIATCVGAGAGVARGATGSGGTTGGGRVEVVAKERRAKRRGVVRAGMVG